MLNHQPDNIEWRANVPFSIQFDDPYYSADNGLAEAQHVFLSGNGLPKRFSPEFQIAELGFGTGLNLLVALAAWRKSGVKGILHFTSFEEFPLTPEQMIKAHEAFPELKKLAIELASLWGNTVTLPDLKFDLILGDARDTLPAWPQKADAWFLDGFSPSKNPELWEPTLMAHVAHHTKAGGSCATYTAAGFVRRGLQKAGFAITRTPGFGRKRHMTQGTMQ
jgi:tRNA U34 5-methylaminomethyl-2-thiouridine-forming methyltransferase MnmC